MTDIKKQLELYAFLKEQEKQIAKGLVELKPIILGYMNEKQAEEIEVDNGKFSVRRIRKWKYPAAIERAEEDLDKAKLEAERLGDATYTESESLVYSPIKK